MAAIKRDGSVCSTRFGAASPACLGVSTWAAIVEKLPVAWEGDAAEPLKNGTSTLVRLGGLALPVLKQLLNHLQPSRTRRVLAEMGLTRGTIRTIVQASVFMDVSDRRDFVPRMIETPDFAQRSGFRDGAQSQINAAARALGSRVQVGGAFSTTVLSVVRWERRPCDAARAPVALRSPAMLVFRQTPTRNP